jgi:hypothetical protein
MHTSRRKRSMHKKNKRGREANYYIEGFNTVLKYNSMKIAFYFHGLNHNHAALIWFHANL